MNWSAAQPMFDQREQVNFFTEWNVRRGASTRVTPPLGRTGASKERLIPDEFYRHAALNLRCFKTAKDQRLLLQRAERDVDTRTSSNKVRTRKLANLFKRPSTCLLRHSRKSRHLFRLDTRKQHRLANLGLRRNGARGDFVAGCRVRSDSAFLFQ